MDTSRELSTPAPKRLRESKGRAAVGCTLAEVERDLILDTLKHCAGNRTHAANILAISIRTLRNKLHEYAGTGLAIPPPGLHPQESVGPSTRCQRELRSPLCLRE
jgi:hypothetical protein